jgi:LysM repeat protein
MSATNVYDALDKAINKSTNTIDLWAAAKSSAYLAGITPVLELFGIDQQLPTPTYVLTSVVLTQSPSGKSVRLTGMSSFRNYAADAASNTTYTVSAALQYTEDGDIFSLALSVQGNWIFSDFFANPELPDTLMQNPAVQPGITWYDSVLIGMTVRGAVFTGQTAATALQMTGLLLEPNNEYLLAKTPMIGPWPLRLSGTLEVPTATRTYPVIDLDAQGNSTIISGAKEPGVDGPDPINISDPGITLLVQPLVPPQADMIAFSTIELFGYFALGEITGRISTLILSTGSLWNFTVRFDKETASLVQGLAQLTRIFGVELPVPMNFPVLSDFYVAEVDIDLQNSAPLGTMPSFSLLNLGISIRSDKTWVPPVPFVTFSDVGTRWVWSWTYVTNSNGLPEKTYTLNGSVFGTINLGGASTAQVVLPGPATPPGNTDLILAETDDISPVSIRMVMSLPDFIISGSLVQGTYISIGDLLNYYFGNEGPSTGSQQMNVTNLRFTADPIGQNYYGEATIFFGDPTSPDLQQGWEINLYILIIILQQLDFNIAVNSGNVSGGISGTFFLKQGDPSDYTLPRIIISAEYPPQNPDAPAGWTLSGYLYPGTSISLTDLVIQFIYGENAQDCPDWVKQLQVTIDRLEASFTTGSTVGGVVTQPSYTFGGTASARWAPTIFDTQLKITASASIDLEKASTSNTASGKISGLFSVNKISLTASMTFGVPEQTYQFKVQFDKLWLEATTSWRGTAPNRHQVVSLQLGGVTLGDILEYLVNLAAPTIGYSLDPPWDVLKKVDLSRFVLTIDPKDNIVEFVFNADVNLVVAQIKTIGVRYSKNGNEGKVDLILTGSFLGQEYTDDKPLTWDVVNDPPPAVPGQGKTLVDLQYLGLGQRVTFSGPTPDTVAQSIKNLRDFMTPPPADGDPMTGSQMEYSADSQWLIGLQIKLMETLDFSFIFNDPKLYGLSIALGGERAGSLAGLKFEILYKKITNDIGMFRVEFQVPDMFRTIQLGVVSITLGIIVIEIYTNGNFKIDLGFPYNGNFDRSFSLQATIFIGRGGFYLGVLNGDTSTQVPKISNGNFSPIIELGIGISAGVGREVKAGILSGGAYVELQVIFQGVLAWFNPDSNGAASVIYFKCQGMAALHGKVYGSVDFVVVKVSVTLEAYAQVSILYESYQPMLITLSVRVSAEASIKILFIRIHFSFSIKLEISFTIGSAQPTPWILSNNTSSGGSSNSLLVAGRKNNRSYALRTQKHRRVLALRQTHHAQFTDLTANIISSDETYVLNWQPANTVFPDSPRKAHMTLLPVFSVNAIPVNWDATVPGNTTPIYRSAFVLFADSGIDPNASTAAQCRVRSSAHSGMTFTDTDTSLLAADILTQGLLLYAINALPRDVSQGNTITAGQVELLLEQLDMPQTMTGGLSISSLATFFQTNINLWISGDTDPRPDEKSAMVVPMPPFLSWTSSQGGNVDFSAENKIGPWYEWGISEFLNPYFPVGSETDGGPGADDPSSYESFTSFMFRDFCNMIIQNGVKEMQKHLNETTVTVQTVSGNVQDLEEVALTLPVATVLYTIKSGDTIESVAASLGATVEELEFLNPTLLVDLQTSAVGTTLTIKLGIAPEILAIDNAEKLFAVNQCELGTLVHQVVIDPTSQELQTLQDIATLFQLTSASTMLAFHDPAYPDLSSGSNILDPKATFNLPQQTFTNAPADFNALRTAAVFFVRYLAIDSLEETPVPEMANWYVQAITELNAAALSQLFPDQSIPTDIELPPGYPLIVPSSFGAAYTTATGQNQYTTVNGDTLYRMGYALVFQQDYGTASPSFAPGWPTFREGVVSAGANAWTIPAQDDILVGPGATIESLVRRVIVGATWTGNSPNLPPTGAWTYDWTNIVSWMGAAEILASLASVTVPGAKTGTSDLSFSILATTYGLTIADAASRLKKVAGLYASGDVLVVKLLPAQDIDVLIDSILSGDSFASIVNQSSRMMMSGLQLPSLQTENGHVVPDNNNLLPLYDLTGQQFNVAVDAAQPTEVALALALTSEQSWIELFNSITVQSDQTLAELEGQYPDLLTYNPGLSAATFKVGMVLLTGPVTTTLDYSYTNAEIISNSPATGLFFLPIPACPPAPSIMPLSKTVPRTYGLDHRIELQSPANLPIPQIPNQAPVTGNPGLWMFPANLLAKAEAEVTTLYEILATQAGAAAGAEAVQIDNSTFGTIIPFKMKRMNESSSEFNLLGVDTDNRELLISLSNWLNDVSGTNTATAWLFISPAPDATNTSGLTGLTAAAADTYILKTNLSSLSVPPSVAFTRTEAEDADATTNVYYAPLSSLSEFLILLWEGSVVGGFGYYFSPGQDIPGSAFDAQGNITVQLLVIANSQETIAPNGRSLLPFNNCALIGAGINSSQFSVFIQSAGSTDPSETIVQAIVPPGNVGFELLTVNPETITSGYTEQEILLKTMFSLLTFEVANSPGSPFEAPASGMPVLPDPTDNSVLHAWEKARMQRKAKAAGMVADDDPQPLPYWIYSQVLPVSRFLVDGTLIAAADVTGLPLPGADPYSGYGTQSSLPFANFVFAFGDVLGNRTGVNGGGTACTPIPPATTVTPGATQIPVGYTDDIISIAKWPSIGRYFKVQGIAPNAQLTLFISPRPSELLPTPSQAGNVNADQIVQQQNQYSTIYYQLIQPGMEGWVVSSLNYIADTNYGNKGVAIGGINALWRFAAGAYVSASSLALMTAAVPTGVTSLSNMITDYGIRYSELAEANADTIVYKLFGAVPVVPAYYPYVEHTSITAMYAMPPSGWPLPPTAVGLLTLSENTILPLKAGTALSIPAITITSGATQPTASLQTLATANNTAVSYLADQNAIAAILQTGFEFTVAIDENAVATVVVDATTNSFNLVVAAFANQGVNVTVDDLAKMHKDETDMLAINQSLSVDLYVIKEGDTLAANSSNVPLTTLANGNGTTLDLFDPGALIYFGNFAGVTVANTAVSLRQFADQYACPMELLLSANASLTLPAPIEFVVPGTLSWPTDTSTVSVPYTIRSTDTLNGIASRFNYDTSVTSAATQLATRNENMPGTIMPDISLVITVGGTPYTVNTGAGNPSFASVLASLQTQIASATLQDIVNAIGSTTGDLNPGGLFICPPAKFQALTAPSSINSTYGVTAGAFALANAAMQGIIAPQITLKDTTGKKTIQTQTNDTFNSLITRFADEEVQISANEIADANMDIAFIISGALAFIPPAEISFTVNIGQGGPYAAPITPLQTSLRLIRPDALISPDFKTATKSGPVEMVESDFPAPTTNPDENTDGLNLNDFIAAMKIALPDLRVGTAQVNGVVQDLWQVDFDDNGIKQVTLNGATTVNSEPQPRFFALMPLYQHLVTRTVPIASLNADGTLEEVLNNISYQGIDVELWARRFVEDMDRFLTGTYATTIYNDTNIRTQLTTVLNAKNALVTAIASGLNTVLDIPDPDKTAALASAVNAIEQQLGVSLSKTYEATVLIQYNSTVDSAWQSNPALLPAELYGDGTIAKAPSGPDVPALTMIAAKTNLAEASSYVNFLMMLDNPALHKDVSGLFNYGISHLEFNISTIGVPENYNASDWLTFLPVLAGLEKPSALSGTDPGAVDVPIPLRNFPDLPKIVTQSAVQSAIDGTQDVSELALWNYEFAYSHQHAEQDYVYIRADFNLKQPDVLGEEETDPKDLFTELAQYMYVVDPLWNLLNGLQDIKKKSPAEVTDIENAVKTFAALSANISEYWTTRLLQDSINSGSGDDLVAQFSYSLNARVSYRSDTNVDTLTLNLITAQPGPNNTWPVVFVYVPEFEFDGNSQPVGMYVPMTVQSQSAAQTIYQVPSIYNVPSSWPQFKIVWTDLNLSGIQNARTQMNVLRNQDLITNVKTNPAFIFSTDTVVAPAVVTPLNTFGLPVDITTLGADASTALDACFKALFGSTVYTQNQKVTMELSYGFTLVPPSGTDPGLVTYLPIGLYADQLLSASTADDLNSAIQTWKSINNPAETGGEWVFSLKLYSQQTDNIQTLLNIERLIYRMG